MRGIPISPGLAEGRAALLSAPHIQTHSGPIADVETEILRLQRAVQAAKDDLRALQNRMYGEFDRSEAEIFSTHRSMLDDSILYEEIAQRIRTQRISAPCAIEQSIRDFARRIGEAADPYLKEREQDVRDIGQRLLRHAGGYTPARFSALEKNTILVASELMPSDLVELDFQHLGGIVVERCGSTSHVAILARALAIPAISGIVNIAKTVRQGQRLLLNGSNGELVLTPNASQLNEFNAELSRLDALSRRDREQAHLPCQTLDGTTVELSANLGRPTETELSACADLSGVGLLRTEFLFLDHRQPPSREQQVAVYRRVAKRMHGNRVVIRTLDLGGDKFPLFLKTGLDNRPAAGERGLRFSLNSGMTLFRQQITALLHVSTDFPLAIMLPMVIGVDDLVAAKSIIEDVAKGLEIERLPPIGALIETPASVMMIEDILGQCDFVGIGTNDLTQFLLAADRNSHSTLEDCSVLHPGVLRSIYRVIQAAAAAGKPVSVCGEAAGIPGIAGILVGMGLRRLSMSPHSSAKVHRFLRQHSLQELARAAQTALSATSIAAVRDVISALEFETLH